MAAVYDGICGSGNTPLRLRVEATDSADVAGVENFFKQVLGFSVSEQLVTDLRDPRMVTVDKDRTGIPGLAKANSMCSAGAKITV